MPNCPEAAFAMLACARIGAPHRFCRFCCRYARGCTSSVCICDKNVFSSSVVFAGFSAEALAERIIDAKSKVLITADEFKRGGKVVPLKTIVDDALAVIFFLFLSFCSIFCYLNEI